MNRITLSLAAWTIAAGSFAVAARVPEPAGFESTRRSMVERLREAEGIQNARVLEAMRETPRHWFVPKRLQENAYYDMALPIGRGQTISPPSMVARMLERLDPQPGDRVLEVGTGTGYQAAVLSRLAAEVSTIEIVGSLARKARSNLRRLGCANVLVKSGDGYLGWPERAPFDRIIVACSPERVPPPLIEQLREGGRIVVPLGAGYDQMLYLLIKTNGVLEREAVVPTVFVPMVGRADSERERQSSGESPALVNGGFEEVNAAIGQPTGWYHQRQMTVMAAAEAPEGERYVLFQSAAAEQTAEASQAFALDGRQVRNLALSGMVKGEELRRGTGMRERASLVVAFYNTKREVIGAVAVGDWVGTFDWRPFEEVMAVPLGSREAVLRVGLSGATGRLSLDDLQLVAVD